MVVVQKTQFLSLICTLANINFSFKCWAHETTFGKKFEKDFGCSGNGKRGCRLGGLILGVSLVEGGHETEKINFILKMT